MTEIQTIIFSGYSGEYEEFYKDSFEIHRDGHIHYDGIIGEKNQKWDLSTNSDGFQLLFSTLSIYVMQENNQIQKDIGKGGYKIEIICEDDEKYIYNFYGTFVDNHQEILFEIVAQFIPMCVEPPRYVKYFILEEEIEEDSIVV